MPVLSCCGTGASFFKLVLVVYTLDLLTLGFRPSKGVSNWSSHMQNNPSSFIRLRLCCCDFTDFDFAFHCRGPGVFLIHLGPKKHTGPRASPVCGLLHEFHKKLGPREWTFKISDFDNPHQILILKVAGCALLAA